MADGETTINDLTQVSDIPDTSLFVVEVSAGTRSITRTNLLPRLSALAVLSPNNINLDADVVGVWDATDGRLAGLSVRDVVFGNYENVEQVDDFTIDPGAHNARVLECRTSFVNNQITLNGGLTGMGGTNYLISNFTPNNLTLQAVGITLHANGTTLASATIRENTSATVIVNNAATEALLSGG